MADVGLADAVRDLPGGRWVVVEYGNGVVACLGDADGYLGVLELRPEADAVVGVVTLGGWPEYSRDLARRLVHAVVGAADGHGARRARLVTNDQIVRHEARALGFRGGLREDLEMDPARRDWSSRQPAPDLAAALQALLPYTAVSVSSSSNPLRRLVERAVSGSGAQIRVDLADTTDRFSVLLPDRTDLMPEVIAMAADTATAIRVRFGSTLGHVKAMSFDLAVNGMSTHRVAGAAERSGPQIHLNATMASADVAAAVRAQDRIHLPGWPSAPRAARFNIDRVTAHEFGHQLDFAFQARRYDDSIEFRRRLGQTLGVETLEAAVRGGEKRADPRAVEAWHRLAQDVSAYATTNAAEAVAELFALWWLGGEQTAPVVRTFAEMMEKYFPVGL